MKNKYAFKELEENMARAMVKDATISTKTSIEIASFLRGKTTKKALAILNRVLKKTTAIPFKRFTDGVGHRAGVGIGAGRFPQKGSEEFIALIKNVEANAQTKGLSDNLKIIHLVVQRGSNQYHMGRQRRRRYKRTHLEIVVQEMEEVKEEVKKAQSKKKESQSKKQETKQEVKKEEKKQPEEKTKESESKNSVVDAKSQTTEKVEDKK
ncbi:50S ribosomal protein L22 [Candidatus Woesearchaeota archaeon]|nr:50S ribosomal protein L22 [Candidatus Woesearchaeota archaeon]MCF7901667.1 50S ribosomal protein L22 [Candidatus Woesearchaeota archaeon]MCF8013341.1 50S ribosomal protein L22 [Candidatus Woesearchaeota archaeon]